MDGFPGVQFIALRGWAPAMRISRSSAGEAISIHPATTSAVGGEYELSGREDAIRKIERLVRKKEDATRSTRGCCGLLFRPFLSRADSADRMSGLLVTTIAEDAAGRPGGVGAWDSFASYIENPERRAPLWRLMRGGTGHLRSSRPKVVFSD